jgi:Cu/Ag efflux pump CusA
MVLAGLVIALGAIVDDAIVDVENIVRRLRLARESGSTQPTHSIILDSSLEVRGAVVYASLIEALALLPIFFLKGVTGSFFKPLAFTYALAVLVSLVVAMISTPALSLILFSRGKVQRRESPVTKGMQWGYERMLRPIVRRPYPAYGAVGALVVTGILVVPLLGQSLFPEFKERDFLMHWLTKPGTSLTEERRIVTAGSKELRQVPGVRNFGSHIGQALLGEEVVGVDFGENWVSIDPHADYDKTRAELDEVVAGYPGMFTNVETYLTERISEVISGASEPIVVRILGPDLKVLRDKAQEIKTMLGRVKGVAAVNVSLQADVPQIEVDVNLAKAKALGIKPGDVRRAAAWIMAGEEVGDIYRNGKTYGVHVWSTPESRNSVDDIRNVLVDTPSGKPVRLAEVASVTLRPAPNFIMHEGSVRRLDVGAEVEGRDLGAVARDIEAGMKTIKFPLEHRVQVIGVYAERQAASRTLFGWAIVTATGIFLILLSVLKRFRLAVLTFVTLPLALIGGVIGNYIVGGVISIGSLVGFFTVLGIVARNGIMMISHFQHLEEQEGVPFGPELVVRGARERVAPIMITALTTALALVPLVVAGNVAGQEIEYPMGAVILGGLVSSTIINLFVVPSLYLRFAKPRPRRSARRAVVEPQPAA